MKNLEKSILGILTAASLVLFNACNESHDHGEAESLEADACEHLGETIVKVEANLRHMSRTIPVVATHVHYEISSPTAGATTGNVLQFKSAAAGDFAFVLGAEVPFALKDSSGTLVEVETEKTTGLPCAEAKVSHTYELNTGTYWLELGALPGNKVEMVIVGGAHH